MDTQSLMTDYDRLNAEIKELSDSIKQSPARRLVPLITRKGAFKGEVHALTPKQYRRYMGKEPRPSIIQDGKIPWHLALDELASERGYKGDEQLKEAIEKLRNDMTRLAELKKERNYIKSQVAEGLRKGPKRETVKTTAAAPVYPKDENVRAEETTVDGTEILSRRNPSFHRVEVDDTGTEKKPDNAYLVRYKRQADKLVSAAVQDAKVKAARQRPPARITRKFGVTGSQIRISPKMPRLK